MSRSTLNFIVDVSLLVLFLSVLSTTGIVAIVFPPGTQATGWHLWGADYDEWSLIQAIAVALFALNVLLHLILHWTWVCGFITARVGRLRRQRGPLPDGIRTLYGVSTLVAILTLLGVIVGAAQFGISPPR
jgi:hypothetical protein